MARLQEFLIPLCSVASFIFSGDTLGSFVYVPCEVIKQRMQIQGTSSSWSSFISRDSVPVKPRGDMYGYYTGMFQAGSSILKEQGPKGLYAGYVNLLYIIIDANWISFFKGLMLLSFLFLWQILVYTSKGCTFRWPHGM